MSASFWGPDELKPAVRTASYYYSTNNQAKFLYLQYSICIYQLEKFIYQNLVLVLQDCKEILAHGKISLLPTLLCFVHKRRYSVVLLTDVHGTSSFALFTCTVYTLVAEAIKYSADALLLVWTCVIDHPDFRLLA